jgi:hypothetical protein
VPLQAPACQVRLSCHSISSANRQPWVRQNDAEPLWRELVRPAPSRAGLSNRTLLVKWVEMGKTDMGRNRNCSKFAARNLVCIITKATHRRALLVCPALRFPDA